MSLHKGSQDLQAQLVFVAFPFVFAFEVRYGIHNLDPKLPKITFGLASVDGQEIEITNHTCIQLMRTIDW